MRKTLSILAVIAFLPAQSIAQEATPSLQRSGGESTEQKMMRLAEILGTLHYVRVMCEPSDGEFWRDRMQEMLRLEKPSLEQKNALTLQFNVGYESASSQFSSCTPEARKLASDKAMEGEALAQSLAGAINTPDQPG